MVYFLRETNALTYVFLWYGIGHVVLIVMNIPHTRNVFVFGPIHFTLGVDRHRAFLTFCVSQLFVT